MSKIYRERIDTEVLEKLKSIDNTKSKKYVNWLSKQYYKEPFDIDNIKSYVDEYDALAERNLLNNDIYSFQSISHFIKEIDIVNETKTASRAELESDYDIIIDNDDLLLIRPNSFEASRKLGLSVFKHRYNSETNQHDSAWCTTYKNNTHWNSYFYDNKVTFYYGLIKNEKLKNELNISFSKVIDTIYTLDKFAIAALPNTNAKNNYVIQNHFLNDGILVDVYDAYDKQITYPLLLINSLKIADNIICHEVDDRHKKRLINSFNILMQETVDGDVEITMDLINNFNFDNVKCKEIKGNLFLNGAKGRFKQIPEFCKNIIVHGDFNCNTNEIESLDFLPKEIHGSIDISHNKLITLKGIPKFINGHFMCAGNLLTTLEYAPIAIKKDLNFNHNQINSLEYAPKYIGGDFSCKFNNITELDLNDVYIRCFLSLSFNKINEIKRFPHLYGGLSLSNNKLTSLIGLPSKIYGKLILTENLLTSLSGLPSEIDSSLHIDHNQISSLVGCPKIILGDFTCTNNKLTHLIGAPEYIAARFDCSDNELETLIGAPKYAKDSKGIPSKFCNQS